MHEAHAAETDRPVAVTPPIVCDHPDDVADVEALEGYRLRVRFQDGLEGVVDLSHRITSSAAGVFSALSDPSRFADARVEMGAVTWPGQIDLAPDAMRDAIDAEGVWTL